MKKIIWASLLSLALNLSAVAAVYYEGSFSSGFQNNGVIPDGTLDGLTDTRNVTSTAAEHITLVQVTLNVSGGYNGDLYAYLGHAGQSLILLNRAGVSSSNPMGYADAGMNVTLADSGSPNIHAYGGGGVPAGTYAPDGQTVLPTSAPGYFNANGGTLTFATTFQGLDPSGNWTLFFADVVDSPGGTPSTLTSWGLRLEVVPEPVNVALSIFGGVFLAVIVVRNPRVLGWLRRRRGVVVPRVNAG
jgi:hypothetical protein